MVAVAVLLAHHVHVGLQDDRGVVFVADSGGHAQDDIHRLVGDALDMVLASEVL